MRYKGRGTGRYNNLQVEFTMVELGFVVVHVLFRNAVVALQTPQAFHFL